MDSVSIDQHVAYNYLSTIFWAFSEVHKTKNIEIHYAEGDECGFNRKYTYCGNLCNTTCHTFNNFCEPQCVRGCLCAQSHAESNLLGICVPINSPLCKWDRLWRN